jgi:hypothetical protein
MAVTVVLPWCAWIPGRFPLGQVPGLMAGWLGSGPAWQSAGPRERRMR